MMDELADKVENLSQRIELAHVEQDSKTVICSLNDLNQEVWKSREAIIKALRFVADMETLVKTTGACNRVEIWKSSPDRVPEVFLYCLGHFSGPDIYTAARKAVEALEKGD